jgi:hypothetical protein
MRFTLSITTRYIDRHPTASMTNNPLVANVTSQVFGSNFGIEKKCFGCFD